MKTKAIQLMAVFFLGTGMIFAQDIPESQVPSVVLNKFKAEFPKAKDVEWEMKGSEYNVEFEIGWFTDYEAWFSGTGQLLRYTEEISNGDLPTAVKDAIKNQHDGYRIDDAKKIVENGTEKFLVEIEKGNDERKLLFSGDGKFIK